MMGSGREELQYLCPNIPTWVHAPGKGFISTSIAQFSYPQKSLYSTSICINVKFILLPADPVRCHSCNSVVNVFSLMQRRLHLVMKHWKALRISLRLNIARPAGGRHTWTWQYWSYTDYNTPNYVKPVLFSSHGRGVIIYCTWSNKRWLKNMSPLAM